MISYDPDKLEKWSDGRWCGFNNNLNITGFCIDSRKVNSGDVFIAIKTTDNDGHLFLNDAKRNGAVAAIVENENSTIEIPQLVVENTVLALTEIARYYRREFNGTVIGITGSCGKTSTKDLLSTLLGDQTVCKTKDNLNNKLGISLTLLSIDPSIHSTAVVEVGISELGEMDELVKILNPDFAIVTLVGEAHISGLGNVKSIAHEKHKLIQYINCDGFALYPIDCKQYNEFNQNTQNHWVLCEARYPNENHNCLLYDYVNASGSKASAITLSSIYFDEFTFDLPSNVVSTGIIRNLAMALGFSLRLGITPSTLQDQLLKWKPSSLRGEILTRNGQTFYVDCYNSNPISMKEALIGFSNYFSNVPRLFVLGCMNELGVESKALHKAVGSTDVFLSSDTAVLIGEQSEELKSGILESGINSSSITIVDSIDEARSVVKSFEGAILLKGSRTYKLEALIPNTKIDIEEEVMTC